MSSIKDLRWPSFLKWGTFDNTKLSKNIPSPMIGEGQEGVDKEYCNNLTPPLNLPPDLGGEIKGSLISIVYSS